MTTKAQKLRKQQRQLRESRKRKARQQQQTRTQPVISKEQQQQQKQLQETKSYVNAEIERLEKAYQEAKRIKSEVRGDSYAYKQADISALKTKGKLDAMKEVRSDLNRGYVITQSEAKRYSESVGESRGSSQQSQYQSRALAEFEYKKALKKYETQLKAQQQQGVTSQVKVQSKYVLGKGYEIRDSKGNLVGYDTGTQTIVATESEKLTDKLSRSAQQKQISKPTLSSETQRYQDFGYSKSEATKLAKESIKVGGQSFTPEISERIIKGEKIEDIERSKSDILKTGLGNIGIGTIQPTQETYQSQTGLFVSTATGVPDVSMSTLFSRPPTPSEKEGIERGQVLGSFAPLPEGTYAENFIEKSLRTTIDFGLGVKEFVTAGGVTASELEKEQIKLNEKVEKFNEKYGGGKELSQKEYDKAQKEAVKLEAEQREIDDKKEKATGTFGYKVSAFTFGTFGRGQLDPLIDPKTKEPVRVLTGDVPIIPALSLGKITDLKFLGTQKTTKAGDIATDLLFTTDKRIGYAKGVSRKEDDIISSIVLGRSGREGFQFPTGDKKIKNIQTFLGTGEAKQKATQGLKSVYEIDKSLLEVTTTDELEFIKNIGFVETITSKGEKIAKPFRYDFSTSISGGIKVKDLTKIKGVSKGAKTRGTRFEGIIRQLEDKPDIDYFGFGTKTSYTKAQQKALQDTISSVAGAVSKPTGIIKSTTLTTTPTSTRIISKPTAREKAVQITQVKQEQNLMNLSMQLSGLEEGTKTRTGLTTLQGLGLEQGITPKTLSLQAPSLIQFQGQTPRQLSRLDLTPSSVTPTLTTPFLPPRIIIPTFFFPKRDLFPTTLRREQGYDVYIKSKGKIIKASKQPLIQSRARDVLSYALDNSLSATGYIKPSNKKPVLNQFNIPLGHYKRTQQKFRTYRVKNKQKIPLRNVWIEKKNKRLDTYGEVKKIQAERVLAQQRRQPVMNLLMPVTTRTSKKKKSKGEINLINPIGIKNLI